MLLSAVTLAISKRARRHTMNLYRSAYTHTHARDTEDTRVRTETLQFKVE